MCAYGDACNFGQVAECNVDLDAGQALLAMQQNWQVIKHKLPKHCMLQQIKVALHKEADDIWQTLMRTNGY